MKEALIFVIGFMITWFASAQIVSIPDPNLKNALVNDLVVDINGDEIGDEDVDSNNNGEIEISEAKAVLNLILVDKSIQSLEGIESFINLRSLNINQNSISEFKTINALSELRVLECNDNELTKLDLTQNIELRSLACIRNEMVNLNISSNELLVNVNCSRNQITELDVSQIENLSTLTCFTNNLSELDVSNNLNLTSLYCGGNKLTEIDVTNNLLLIFFTCGGNSISEIDLSRNKSLSWIQCHDNEPLSYLNIKNGANEELSIMWAQDCPNLSCILVDDPDYSNLQKCGFPTIGWCKDVKTQYSQDCLLEVGEEVQSAMKIYPSPVHDLLMVDCDRPIKSIRIISMSGSLINEVVLESQINVADLTSGLYIVQVKRDDEIITKKFIKS